MAVALLASACAEGGRKDRVQSEIKIQANHHLVGLIGFPEFGSFPVKTEATAPFLGNFSLTEDSRYELRSGATVLGSGEYALSRNAELSVLVPTSLETVVFRGAYGLAERTNHLFFTDRVGERVGLYFGTRRASGAPDRDALAGMWHLMSMHVLFADDDALPGIHEVGRAFGGTITLDADGSISGNGSESTNSAARLPVTAPDDSFKAFRDGVFEFELRYGNDRRTFEGGGDGRMVFAVDGDERDGATGLLAMLRAQTRPLDPTDLAGTWVAGVWTVFLKPTASGVDAAIGTLEFTPGGAFRLEAVNNTRDTFRYTGTIDPIDNRRGAFDVDVSGTDEKWFGAVDDDYATVVMVDPFVERRSNNQVEINLIIAIRRVD